MPNDRLRAAREERCESQSEFARALHNKADELGVNLAMDPVRLVQRWEAGEVRWPRASTRRVLIALTGLSPEQLGFVQPNAVHLGEAVASGSREARQALVGALRSETSRENLRAIGLGLNGERPWT